MILLDLSQTVVAVVFQNFKSGYDPAWAKTMFYRTVNSYVRHFGEEFGQLVVAADMRSVDNWRKNKYSFYKGTRAKRDQDPKTAQQWATIYEFNDSIVEEIKTNARWPVIQQAGAEADDIIAVLTRHYSATEPVLIISSDDDFAQLHENENVAQWVAVHKRWKEVHDPQEALRLKILRGDRGDGIPNILSPVNAFMDGIKQSKITESIIQEWMCSPEAMLTRYKDRIAQNTELIDFNHIPKDIQRKIMSQVTTEQEPEHDVFYPPKNSYRRRITPVRDYKSQAALFLHINSGKPVQECMDFVQQGLAGGFEHCGIRNPMVKYLERGENGDRQEMVVPLTGYLRDSVSNREIIAPTLTTYLHPDVKESVLSGYVDYNISVRSKAKKEMFSARAAGDHEKDVFSNAEQRTKKTANNSISGAHVSASQPLANKSAHSTLTSNCRLTSTYGSANNERILAGIRHYWSAEVVMNNITSIIAGTDEADFKAMVDKYGLKYPDADEVFACIMRSANQYWDNKVKEREIMDYIRNLTPIQCAMVMYTGDLYHVLVHNEGFMRKFLGDLSKKVTGEIDNEVEVMKAITPDLQVMVYQINSADTVKKDTKYEKHKGEQWLKNAALTALNIQQVLHAHRDFIRLILVSNNLPPTIAYFPQSIRHVAITGDTDSTIFTVKDWVYWYYGQGAKFEEKTVGMASTMVFLASQSIVHVLATMSINAGIPEKHMYRIAMKNEFFFPFFAPTMASKHYNAAISCQEGLVFDHLEREIKGVHLKNSNTPKAIMKKAEDMMIHIQDTALAGEKIVLFDILKQIADVERTVFEGIRQGEDAYFRRAQIKQPNSYKKEKEQSPYFQHLLWNEVFGIKYGEMVEPPYDCIRVALDINNKSDFTRWMNSIEDKDFVKRLQDCLIKYNKKEISSILVPKDIVREKGLPAELLHVVDSRSIVGNICNVFYLILDTLGYGFVDEKRIRLISDFY